MIKMNKAASASFAIFCLLSILFLIEHELCVKASFTWTVDTDGTADFKTIQKAINNASSGDTILVHDGTYYGNIIVNKTVCLIGKNRESTIIDGNESGSVISVAASNATIKNFTIQRSGNSEYDSGIFIGQSFSGNNISHNNITNNYYGINLHYSINNLVSHNNITNNYYGINLHYSINNLVSHNNITNNYYNGISLLYSRDNTFFGNMITKNHEGISLFLSDNNVFFHNNFINNIEQTFSYNSINVWDNGVEGNYWSSYTGVDLFSGLFQNETGGDGIGDAPHIIYDYSLDEENLDRYPLMGIFSCFRVALKMGGYQVNIICNLTISGFGFDIGLETGNRIIRFAVAGAKGTVGFCRVKIPTELMTWPYMVLVGTEEIDPTVLFVSNKTYVHLYFTYDYSKHAITIISRKILHLYNELVKKYNELNLTYYDQLNNLLTNYTQLQENHHELHAELSKLNLTYYDQLNNLLTNYTQLQENHHELNEFYQKYLSDYPGNMSKLRNLIYIFLAATAVFLISIIYLSKQAHAGKPSPNTKRRSIAD